MLIIGRAGGWTAGLLTLCVVFLSSGCGVVTTRQPLPSVGPDRVLLESVPFYPQRAYQCGPAALAMVLAWSGSTAEPDDLTPEVYSPGLKGSLQPSLVGAARRHGLVAYPIAGIDALFAEVAAGTPVVVLQNLGFFWYPKWHYAVVIGYDRQEGEIVLHSGDRAAERLSVRVFENTWARSDYWGLLVLPPDRLPATAEEEKYLSAAAGLERAGQWGAAVIAYRTALSAWPDSLAAWMGLGNSSYMLGDFGEAEQAFRRAAGLAPTEGAAFNNLAQTLWKQGRRQEALQAARRAVALGGPLQEIFEQTLQEIQSGN